MCVVVEGKSLALLDVMYNFTCTYLITDQFPFLFVIVLTKKRHLIRRQVHGALWREERRRSQNETRMLNVRVGTTDQHCHRHRLVETCRVQKVWLLHTRNTISFPVLRKEKQQQKKTPKLWNSYMVVHGYLVNYRSPISERTDFTLTSNYVKNWRNRPRSSRSLADVPVRSVSRIRDSRFVIKPSRVRILDRRNPTNALNLPWSASLLTFSLRGDVLERRLGILRHNRICYRCLRQRLCLNK